MRKLPILLLTATLCAFSCSAGVCGGKQQRRTKTASQYLGSHGIMVGDGREI